LKASLISATPSVHAFCLPILHRTYPYRIFLNLQETGKNIAITWQYQKIDIVMAV